MGRHVTGVCLFLVVALVVSGPSFAGPKEMRYGRLGGDDSKQDPVQAAATPGEHHEHLTAFVGSWKTRTKSWATPDAKPEESDGRAEFTSVLGGRFLKQRYTGRVMDSLFEGIGFLGYDNAASAYESVWMDSMGTGMARASGTCGERGRVLVMDGEYFDPATGATKTYRTVTRWVDEGGFVVEMYGEGPDGSRFKNLEIHHTRM